MADPFSECETATGAREIVRFLADHGHRHVFGLPGSQLVSVFHAMQAADIVHVPTIHESVTVAAADGYARVAGSAVAMVYMLPGTANALANIYNAARDETPLIVLASQQLSTVRTRLGAFCEGDTVPLVQPFTRLAHELTKGTPVRSWLEKALRAAKGTPGGPAYLSLTEEVLTEAGPIAQERLSQRAPNPLPDVREAAARLRAARRPLIVSGGQLRRYGGSEALEALAARHDIPVAHELGLIDRLGIGPGHSHCVGSLLTGGAAFERDADVVLMLGTRNLTEASPRATPYFPKAEWVGQVNADQDKLEDTRRADWVCAGDPGAFAKALFTALDAAPATAEIAEERHHWALGRPQQALPPGPLGKLFTGFGRCLAPLHDALDRGWVIDESVMASTVLTGTLRSADGRRYVGTSGASLGWATGAAVGVALASGEPVTVVLGDGSVRFGAQGLWTIRAMNLPITLIVLDNHGYASTRNYEREHVNALGPDASPQRPSYANMDMRETGPDVADMIAGFGIPTRRLSPDDDLRAAVERAWVESADGPNALIMPVGFEDE